MDSGGNEMKSLVLAGAALNFDERELEAVKQQQSEELARRNNELLEARKRNLELKSNLESQSRYISSVQSSTTLLRESKESLLKEKAALLKQLELQRIANVNEKKQNEATLSNYVALWEQILSKNDSKPLVQVRNNLENDKKKLEIELRVKEKEFYSLKENLKQFVDINEKIFQINIIKLAQAWTYMNNESVKNEQLRRREKELMQQAALRSSSPQKSAFLVSNLKENVPPRIMSIENLPITFTSSNARTNLSKIKELQESLDTHQLSPQKRTNLHNSRSSLRNASMRSSLYDNSSHSNINQSGGRVEEIKNCNSTIKCNEGFDNRTLTSKSSQIPILNRASVKRKAVDNKGSKAQEKISAANDSRTISNNDHFSMPKIIMSPKESRIPVSCRSSRDKKDNSSSYRSIRTTHPVEPMHSSANATFKLPNTSEYSKFREVSLKDKTVELDEDNISNQPGNVQDRGHLLNETFSIPDATMEQTNEGDTRLDTNDVLDPWNHENNAESDQLMKDASFLEENVSSYRNHSNIKEQMMETKSPYFQEGENGKENFPPSLNVQSEQLPDDQASFEATESEYNGNEAEYASPTSPPLGISFNCPSPPGFFDQPENPECTDLNNFFKGLDTQRTSSPQHNSCKEQDDNHASQGLSNFFFKSAPKPRSSLTLMNLF